MQEWSEREDGTQYVPLGGGEGVGAVSVSISVNYCEGEREGA